MRWILLYIAPDSEVLELPVIGRWSSTRQRAQDTHWPEALVPLLLALPLCQPGPLGSRHLPIRGSCCCCYVTSVVSIRGSRRAHCDLIHFESKDCCFMNTGHLWLSPLLSKWTQKSPQKRKILLELVSLIQGSSPLSWDRKLTCLSRKMTLVSKESFSGCRDKQRESLAALRAGPWAGCLHRASRTCFIHLCRKQASDLILPPILP